MFTVTHPAVQPTTCCFLSNTHSPHSSLSRANTLKENLSVCVCVCMLWYVSHTNAVSNPGMSLPVSAEAALFPGICGKLIRSLFSCLTVERAGTVIPTSVTTATRLKEPESRKKKKRRKRNWKSSICSQHVAGPSCRCPVPAELLPLDYLCPSLCR